MKDLILNIDNLGMSFEGVARDTGKVFFVPNALVGEKIKAELIDDKEKFATARLTQIIEQSKDRIEPFCPYFNECGGCVLQHLLYEKQLEYKTKHIEETIKKVAGISCQVSPCIASSQNYYYRNKGAFPIVDTDSGCKMGMFKDGTHTLLRINQCFLMNNEISLVFDIVSKYLSKNNIKGYNFTTYSGDAKFLVVRSINNQTLVCLVGTKKLPKLDELYQELAENISNVGLYFNLNTQHNQTILGDLYEHVAGIKEIQMEEFGVNYNIGIASFMQINNDIKEKLYSQILDNVSGGIVIDAYAGAGLLSAIMCKKADFVYSVEIVKQATDSAKELMKSNNITNMKAVNGDCGVVLPKIVQDLHKKDFTIVLDPARVGCDKKVIEVAKCANKIIYVSCNPISLAKDLKILELTHKIETIQPFDMFPQTKHVETLCVLIKK